MKRIFYYSGYRLTVFHWMRNRFIASYAFNPDEEGLENFHHYLRSTDNYPARILVDVIEESFGLETIPHVGHADKKAIVRRLVEKRNRDSVDYSYFKFISRELAGRRDDNILLSVLTNPGLLAPWLKLIEKAGVAISGVWSLPLVSEKLVAKMGLTEGNVLLLSQQVPSNIRQSYFKDGKFQTSRSAGINQYEAPIGEYVAEEVDQSVRYLANHRFIGFDEKINAHIICNRNDEASIVEKIKDSPAITFHIHYVDEIEELVGCEAIGEDYCNGVFSNLCKDEFIAKSHYGPKNLFQFYYQQLTEKTLRILTISILIVSIISAISFVANTSSLDDEISVLNQNTLSMEKAYASQLQALEPELRTSRPMMSSVLLYEKMLESKHIVPQNFMVEASKVLSRVGMHDVTITNIKWQRAQEDRKKSTNKRNKNKQSGIKYSLNSEIKHKVELSGYIHGASSDKKAAADKINLINKTFSESKRFESVKISEMSLDMRPEKNVEDEAGVTHLSRSEDTRDGFFKIEMTMKGRPI